MQRLPGCPVPPRLRCLTRLATCLRSLGHGVVKYGVPVDAQRAVESLNGRLLCRQALDVRLGGGGGRGAAPGGGPQPPGGNPGDPTPSPNLYIKGLPPGTTDVGLRNVFAPFGAIMDSRILYPESSSPSALLRYTSVQEAAAAIAAMHGVTPPGAVNMLQVRFAESAADKARRAAQLGAGRPGPPGPGTVLGMGTVSRVGTVHLPAGVEAIDKLECPPTLVGWLIGRSGETIKSLQLRSGCVISIDQTMGDGQPRVVNIAGTREQVALGRQLVEELLVSGAARSGGSWAPPERQSYASGVPPPPPYGGGGGDHYYQHRGPTAPGPQPPPQAMAPPPPLALPAPRMAEPEEPDPCVVSRLCRRMLVSFDTCVRARALLRETPVYDADEGEATKQAAAECEDDLPEALRAAVVDAAVFDTAAIREAQRLAAGRLMQPAPPMADQLRMCDDCLRGVLMHWQQFVEPPPAALDALSSALASLLPLRWTAAGEACGEPRAGDEDGEEFVAMALACAAHFADGPEFERFASASSRSVTLGAAGLAAAAVLCCEQARALQFLRAGGADLLLSVVSWQEAPTRARGAALTALAAASCHPDACAVLADSAVCTLVELLLYPAPTAEPARLTRLVVTRCTIHSLAARIADGAAGEGVSAAVQEVTQVLRLVRQAEEEAVESDLAGADATASGPMVDPAIPHILHSTRVLPAVLKAMHAGDLDPAVGGALLAECGATQWGVDVLCAEAEALCGVRQAPPHPAVADLATVAALAGWALHTLLNQAQSPDDGDSAHTALLSLARLCRHPTQREQAALLLCAKGVPEALLAALQAPPVAAAADSQELARGLAARLLLEVVRDPRAVCLRAWLPLAERLHACVRHPDHDGLPHALALRAWAAAGARCVSTRPVAGLVTWLAQLESGDETVSGPAEQSSWDAAGRVAYPAESSLAGLSAGSVAGMQCALRLLRCCAAASPDDAAALFGADVLAVAARITHRAAVVLRARGACSDGDAAALEEDTDVGPELGPVRRCMCAAQVMVDAARLTGAVLHRVRDAGVQVLRSTPTVGAAMEGHAAAAVLHAAGGPAAPQALAARRAAAAVCALWATGPPGWHPRLLVNSLKAACGTTDAADGATVMPGPTAALSAWLLLGDVLPPAGQPGEPLSGASRERLCQDAGSCQKALCDLLAESAASAAPAVALAATRALARMAALGGDAPGIVARACGDALEVCRSQRERRAAQEAVEHIVQVLTGSDTTPADVEGLLRGRFVGRPDHPGAPLAACVEAQPAAALAAALGAQAAKPELVTWYVREDSIAAEDDLSHRRRVLRAELLGKRGPAKATLAADPLAGARPAVRRKMLAGGGTSRTIHVDDYEAMEKGRKGDADKQPLGAAPVPAPPLPPVPAPAAPAAKPMLSIRFGAAAAAPQPAEPAPGVAAAVAEPAQVPSSVEPNFFEADMVDVPPHVAASVQPAEYHPPALPAHPLPAAPAAVSMIPGLGGGLTIPGLGAAPAAALPGLGPPRALPPPKPPAGPPPPSALRPPAPPAPSLSASSAAALQQMLSSPEAIQSLLSDPERLRALLEEFPHLAQVLQARLQGQ